MCGHNLQMLDSNVSRATFADGAVRHECKQWLGLSLWLLVSMSHNDLRRRLRSVNSLAQRHSPVDEAVDHVRAGPVLTAEKLWHDKLEAVDVVLGHHEAHLE